ncbi:unnamed protein product [Penicillium salamii]|nr:unnamed protein product [Penicillium salamii]
MEPPSVLAVDNAGTEFDVETIGIGVAVGRIEPGVGYIDAEAEVDAAGIEMDGMEAERAERMVIADDTDFAPEFVAVISAVFADPAAASVAAPVAAAPTFVGSTSVARSFAALDGLAFPAVVGPLASAVPRPSVAAVAVQLAVSRSAVARLAAAQYVAAQPVVVQHAAVQCVVAPIAAVEFAFAAPEFGVVQVVVDTVGAESAAAIAAVSAVSAGAIGVVKRAAPVAADS